MEERIKDPNFLDLIRKFLKAGVMEEGRWRASTEGTPQGRVVRAAIGHLSQKKAAELIGMKGLYSYQRLESSKTANPEFETIVRIKKAFPEFEVDELVG